MAQKDILFPVGRLIGGSVTRGDTTDSKGQPIIVKTGPNKGAAGTKYNFGVAFPKNGTTSWTQTEWGALIYAAGIEGYPNGEIQRPDFSWKVIDGDSAIPNKSLKKPCDQVGYPGHWVVWFSSFGAPPRLFDIIGNKKGDPPRPLVPPMEILPGYFVQVYGSAKDNKPSESPGVYINYDMVGLVGYGERISTGTDANQVGFGGAALPAGASTVPTGGMVAPPPAAGAIVPPPGAIVPPPVAAPIPVAPNPAILAAPPAPPPPAPPPAQRVVMTAQYTYDQLKTSNYSDEQMVAQNFARWA